MKPRSLVKFDVATNTALVPYDCPALEILAKMCGWKVKRLKPTKRKK